MSYAERRRRKNQRAHGVPTPRQRRLHPELYGQRGELDRLTVAETYAIEPDGTRTLLMVQRIG